MQEEVKSTLQIEEKKRLMMTGVVAVDSFSEENITVTLLSGRMFISGDGLKITAFSKGTGALSVEGNINSVKYGNKKMSFFKRLFR